MIATPSHAVVNSAPLSPRKQTASHNLPNRLASPFTNLPSGIAYLTVGFATLGLVTYSAYLGSQMVYAKGMGVEAADGLRPGDAPEMLPANAGEVVKIAASHLRDGVKHAIQNTSNGKLIPTMRSDMEEHFETKEEVEERPMRHEQMPPMPGAE